MTTTLPTTTTGTAVATTSTKRAAVAFNYATDLVAGADPRDLERCRDQINASLGVLKKASVLIRDIGEDLVAAKAIVGHGKWGPWLKAEFDMDERTAQRYMKVYRELGHIKSDILSYLDKGTLYDLCNSSFPERTRKSIIGAMADGQWYIDEVVRKFLNDALREEKAAKARKARRAAATAAAAAAEPAPAKAATSTTITLDGDETTALRLLDVMRRDLKPEQFEEHARLTAEVSPAFRKVLDDHEKAKAEDEASDERETIEATAADEIIEAEFVEIVESDETVETETVEPETVETETVEPETVETVETVETETVAEEAPQTAEAEVIDDDAYYLKPDNDVIEELDLGEAA